MNIITYLLSKSKLIISIMLIITIINIIYGKLKWHFYPIYGLFLMYIVLLILDFYNLLNLETKVFNYIVLLGLVLVILPGIFLLVFPTLKIPTPSGDYAVGTKIYEVEDVGRNETYGDVNLKRKIKYQIYYPSDKTYGFSQAKWISDGKLLTRAFARDLKLPSFILDQTASIKSNSFINAPVSDKLESFPVVLISHGWRGFREFHTDYAEELASNGYIVISIDHTYGSQLVSFKDGSIAKINREALPNFTPPKKFLAYSSALATTYGKDVLTVLDDLENLNKNDTHLQNKLDLESIGLLGHSTGGGGMVYVALEDSRIKALMGLDAWVEPLKGYNIDKGLQIPSLYLRSEQWSKRPNSKYLNIIINNSAQASLIELAKTKHIDFSMAYMYSPVTKYINFTGKLGGRKSSEIQRELILEFFNKNLRYNLGSENYLSDIEDKHKAVQIIK